MNKTRKREWFDDESFWRELEPFMFTEQRYADAAASLDQVLRLARPRGKAVLDLGCGPGRWAIPLAKRGFRVTGVDRTAHLLRRARARAQASRARIEWIREDMRDFVRPEAFDLVLSMFTSFGYFDDPNEDVAVLRDMFTSLRPGGVCLVEVMGKETLARILQPTSSERLPDGQVLVQRHEVFDAWSRMRNEWTLIRRGQARTWSFHHTLYAGRELRDRFEQTGFTDVRLFGSFAGEEYGVTAMRLIAIGR